MQREYSNRNDNKSPTKSDDDDDDETSSSFESNHHNTVTTNVGINSDNKLPGKVLTTSLTRVTKPWQRLNINTVAINKSKVYKSHSAISSNTSSYPRGGPSPTFGLYTNTTNDIHLSKIMHQNSSDSALSSVSIPRSASTTKLPNNMLLQTHQQPYFLQQSIHQPVMNTDNAVLGTKHHRRSTSSTSYFDVPTYSSIYHQTVEESFDYNLLSLSYCNGVPFITTYIASAKLMPSINYAQETARSNSPMKVRGGAKNDFNDLSHCLFLLLER